MNFTLIVSLIILLVILAVNSVKINIEFFEIIKSLHQKLIHNVVSMYDYSEASHVNMNIIKTVYLFVTEEFIKTLVDKLTISQEEKD